MGPVGRPGAPSPPSLHCPCGVPPGVLRGLLLETLDRGVCTQDRDLGVVCVLCLSPGKEYVGGPSGYSEGVLFVRTWCSMFRTIGPRSGRGGRPGPVGDVGRPVSRLPALSTPTPCAPLHFQFTGVLRVS